ncbi:hypothetical protein V5T82_10480 [Magnetovibrio sp. PR-2]|uniref:hypothetical protein n=1 Tax=Magnetovibrio sp. PR-2 TaxID=3120356 RepID=UPI002FCE5E5E
MKNCDDCPGSVKCTSTLLHPILVQVYDLYAGGTRDKFDILFSLSDDDEEALELCDAQVSRACWTKAALLAMVDVVMRLSKNDLSNDPERALYGVIETARDAFSSFPWHIEELVDQAPELYALILERCETPELCNTISKRAFIKACKDIAYTT